MSRESDDQRKAREAGAVSDFRAFLSNFKSYVALATLGVDESRTSTYLLAAKEDGRVMLGHLLRRDPTEVEVERFLGLALALEKGER